ncbi:MAG: hypothetical protein B0W54_12560 [Cellvibrio sp. 79]|nr:MAG: hypothetical protein B0W54_12560 [Cellvibrio sp. 79]
MENSLKIPDNLKSKNNSNARSSFKSQEIAGRITNHIGSGRNAKDSFIWMTITWSFYIAGGMSFLLFVSTWFEVVPEENLLESITKIWSTFIPIITLALGYAFGKGE